MVSVVSVVSVVMVPPVAMSEHKRRSVPQHVPGHAARQLSSKHRLCCARYIPGLARELGCHNSFSS